MCGAAHIFSRDAPRRHVVVVQDEDTECVKDRKSQRTSGCVSLSYLCRHRHALPLRWFDERVLGTAVQAQEDAQRTCNALETEQIVAIRWDVDLEDHIVRRAGRLVLALCAMGEHASDIMCQ
jgi:hypothetical protein